ncbi:MAG: hypothetical protein ACHQF2_10410 [Flavobacteriales bacterium]
MSGFLDYIVSNSWLFMIVFIFFAGMVTVIWFFRPFKKWQFNRAMHIICSLGFFAILMYLLMGPNGYAVNFTDMRSNGHHICLVEQHEQGHGDGGSSTEHRVYILDLKTGERIYRMTNDYGRLLMVRDSFLILYEREGAIAYDLKEGNEVKRWGKEKGFENFSELTSGIQDITSYSGSYYGLNNASLGITAMNGKKYHFNLTTEKLTSGNGPAFNNKGVYNLNENEIRYEHEGYYQWEVYSFKDVEGEIRKLQYSHYDGTKKELNEELLAPDFVTVNDEKKYFVIKHFEGLDRKNAILTAVTFDMQKKWEVRQNLLDVSDHYNDTPEIGRVVSVNNNILVTFGGFIVYLNGENGQVIWKSRQ